MHPAAVPAVPTQLGGAAGETRNAYETPVPSFEPLGQARAPLLIRSSAVHLSSLVPSSFTPFGRSRTICLTVVLLSGVFVTLKVNFAAAGFFEVPALDGEIETSLFTTGAGF
jgi:hypothetical protein